MAHEDKTYPGALIASLSIPWGEVKGDEDLGGYHLVWTRDMVNSATGLMATGNDTLALRALIYLAATQLDDGGFYQNFWINGEPYWKGIQLDEVAFPIMLAWRLFEAGGLKNFDPMPMVKRAAKFLILHGPATGEERWEENGGYSPSTLAVVISALVCASHMLRRIEGRKGQFLLDYADFLESNLERWTVTTQGVLVPGISRHFIRILPIDLSDPRAPEDPNNATIPIKNRPPGAQYEFPAKEVVDAGFLELVRYGIRAPGDPLIEDSLRVVDACLKVDLPQGPCWRRYNNDGYGQQADGRAWHGYGVGRPWPLLTGERGHYELAAGRDVRPYVKAIEDFASATGLLPEQVWDATRQATGVDVFGQTYRGRDAADVGARGIYQAAALDPRRQGLRYDSRSGRALSGRPAPGQPGGLEIQSPGQGGRAGCDACGSWRTGPSCCIGAWATGATTTTPIPGPPLLDSTTSILPSPRGNGAGQVHLPLVG